MKVKAKHGVGTYNGKRWVAGDELEITDVYFASNPGRFEPLDNMVQNIKPKRKRRTKEEIEADQAENQVEADNGDNA